MAHRWLSHATYCHVLPRIDTWIISHVWIRHAAHTHTHTHTHTYTHTHVGVLEGFRVTRHPVSHTWMRHVTHMNEYLARINESRHTRQRLELVTHMNESCHLYEWVMSHIWMSHITHVNESYHTCEWVISRMWMSHITHMNESCHTYEWVMSHIWMSHVKQIAFEHLAHYISLSPDVSCRLSITLERREENLPTVYILFHIYYFHRVYIISVFPPCVHHVREESLERREERRESIHLM